MFANLCGNLAEMQSHFNSPVDADLSVYPVYPSGLADAEMALVRFDLDLLEPCTLHLDDLLGLRQRLHRAADHLPSSKRATIFDPPLSSDPASVRRYQKPAPSFVIRSVESLAGEHLDGDSLQLEIFFLGTGVLIISDFLTILQNLGRRGLIAGGGYFEISSARCQGTDGKWRCLWRHNQPSMELTPDLQRLDQWLDRNWPKTSPLQFELMTPARLVAGGRVLRRPRFTQLFRFMLRRVSSMLYAHCAIELDDEPVSLLSAADQVEGEWLTGRWIDWREIDAGGKGGSVGGVTGQLQFAGPALDELLWVVLLATLFGIGRGATYGAGGCRLSDMLPQS